MVEATDEQQATIDAFEKEILEAHEENMANETVKPVTATDQLLAMYANSTKGFSDRQNTLEEEIKVRQLELADVKVAIKSIEAAVQAIEAGRSLNKTQGSAAQKAA